MNRQPSLCLQQPGAQSPRMGACSLSPATLTLPQDSETKLLGIAANWSGPLPAVQSGHASACWARLPPSWHGPSCSQPSLTSLARVLQGLPLPAPVIGSDDLVQKGPAIEDRGRGGKLYNWFLKTRDFHFCSHHCIELPETSLHTEQNGQNCPEVIRDLPRSEDLRAAEGSMLPGTHTIQLRG